MGRLMGPRCKMCFIYISFSFLSQKSSLLDPNKWKKAISVALYGKESLTNKVSRQPTLESSSRWLETKSMKFAKPDGIKSNQIETEVRNRSTNLVEMLSERNPMVEQFVPPSLANHDRYFDNRFRFKFVRFFMFRNKIK
jgi:hypothetical protein